MRRALLAALAACLLPLRAAAQGDDPDSLPPLVSEPLRAELPWMALSAADARAEQKELAPSDRAVALRQAGEIRLDLGDVPGAERDFARALELAPDDAETLLDAAKAARARPADALSLARRAARKAKSARRRGAALREAGEALLDLGDRKGARRELAKALAGRPEDLEILRSLARASSPEEAAGLARRSSAAAAAAPEWLRAAAWRLAGRTWLDLGEKPEAASCFREAERAEPDDLDALESRLELAKEGVAPTPAPAAAAAPEPARLEDDPADLVALDAAVEAALSEARSPEAKRLLDRFEDSIRKAPSWQRIPAYRECGRLWSALGENDAALECAHAARGLDTVSPATRRLQYDLGERDADVMHALLNGCVAAARAKKELGDEPGAADSLKHGLDAAPRDATLLDEYFALELSRDPRAARLIADQLVEAARNSGASALAAAWRREAQALSAEGDERGAETALKRALEAAPGDAATERLASALAVHRRDAQAASATRAAGLRARAQEARARGDDAGAREALEQALELATGDAETLDAAFELWLAVGDARRADALADRLIAAQKAGPAAGRAAGWRSKALARRALGDAAGARRAVEKALALSPSDPATLVTALDLESSSPGRAKAAEELASRLVKAVAEEDSLGRSAAYRRLASARLSLGDVRGARGALEQALALSPAEPAALRAALDSPCFSRAEKAPLADKLVAASESSPPARRAAAYRLRAGLSLERGDEAAALADVRRALELSPGEPDDLWTALYLGRAAPARSLALLDGLPAAEAPEAAARRAVRSMALRLAGRPDDADRELAGAFSDGGDAVCSRSLFRTRRESLDVAYLDACAKRRPKDAELLNDRGVARYLAGDLDGAAADFQRVVALEPGNRSARSSLSTVLADRARLKK